MVVAIIVVSYYSVIVLTWGPKLLVGGAESVLSFAIMVVFHILVNSYSISKNGGKRGDLIQLCGFFLNFVEVMEMFGGIFYGILIVSFSVDIQ